MTSFAFFEQLIHKITKTECFNYIKIIKHSNVNNKKKAFKTLRLKEIEFKLAKC